MRRKLLRHKIIKAPDSALSDVSNLTDLIIAENDNPVFVRVSL